MAAPRPTPTAKSERTRNAVVRALEALIEEGDLTPSAGDIAARAGVSLRSVYVRFASVGDLHLAVAERATGRVLTMLWPIDPEAPLTVRIDDLVRQRARQRGVGLPLILSDHADWDELTATIEEVNPAETWITHGREDALLHQIKTMGRRGRALSLVGYEDEDEPG